MQVLEMVVMVLELLGFKALQKHWFWCGGGGSIQTSAGSARVVKVVPVSF